MQATSGSIDVPSLIDLTIVVRNIPPSSESFDNIYLHLFMLVFILDDLEVNLPRILNVQFSGILTTVCLVSVIHMFLEARDHKILRLLVWRILLK